MTELNILNNKIFHRGEVRLDPQKTVKY